MNYSVKSLVVNFCDTVDGKHPAPPDMQIMGHLPSQPVSRISEPSTVVRVSPLFQKHIGYGKMFCNCLFHLGCYTVTPIATLVILNFVDRWSYCMVGQMGLEPCYGSKRVGTPNILLYTLFCCKQKIKDT